MKIIRIVSSAQTGFDEEIGIIEIEKRSLFGALSMQLENVNTTLKLFQDIEKKHFKTGKKSVKAVYFHKSLREKQRKKQPNYRPTLPIFYASK